MILVLSDGEITYLYVLYISRSGFKTPGWCYLLFSAAEVVHYKLCTLFFRIEAGFRGTALSIFRVKVKNVCHCLVSCLSPRSSSIQLLKLSFKLAPMVCDWSQGTYFCFPTIYKHHIYKHHILVFVVEFGFDQMGKTDLTAKLSL